MRLRDKFRFSFVEVLMAVAIIFIIARVIWAKELLDIESNLFHWLGFNDMTKHVITVPLFVYILYSYYRKGADSLKGTGQPVVRKGIWVFVIISLFCAIPFFFYTVRA